MSAINPAHVPWKRARLHLYRLRRWFFTRPKPDHEPYIVVDATMEEVDEALRREHFICDWALSYNYEGEVLNKMRAEYVDDEYMEYQTHLRTFEHPEGVEILAHFELDPTGYPQKHIEEVNFDIERGVDEVAAALERQDMDFEVRGEP